MVKIHYNESHRYTIVEDEILKFLQAQKPFKPAREYDLQTFFSHIAKKKEIATENEREWKHQRVTEATKTKIMNEYVRRKQEVGIKTKLSQKYWVNENMILKLTKYL